MRTRLQNIFRRNRVARATALGALMISGTGLAAGPILPAQAQSRAATHPAIMNALLKAQLLQMGAGSRHTLRARRATQGITVIVHARHDVSAAIRALHGSLIADIKGHMLAAHVPLDAVNGLSKVPGVIELYPDEVTHPRLDQSVPEIGANKAWLQNDNTGLPIQGSHVLVGIVDSGIDYHNADFKNADGTTRIKYIWDQTANGQPPAGFNFGNECDAASINSGQCTEKDIDGHGTHVAGIAAGNGNASGGHEIGVAPKADIIVVKRGGHTSQDLAAWQYLLEKSQQLHEPIAINNSFGGMISPHNGTSDLDLAADQIVGPGRVLVAAAGNEGNSGLHADATVENGKSVSVPMAFTGYDDQLTLGLYYHATDTLSFSLHNVDTGQTYGPIVPGKEIDGATAYDGDTHVTIAADNWDATEREIVLLMGTDSGAPLIGHYTLDLKGTQVTDNGRFDAWIDQDQSAQFANPDETDTINEPGDSRSVIAVGNYATRVSWTDRKGATHYVCDYYLCNEKNTIQVGEINFSSSIGPTADNRLKPDISAPGTMILSSRSHDAPVCTSNETAECLDPTLLASDGVSVADTGTSMSAPHVTGVAALMLQANPNLDQRRATSILTSTARHDSFTGPAAWSPQYGAGKVDALAAVEAALATSHDPTPTPGPTETPTVTPPRIASFTIDKVRIQSKDKANAPAVKRVKVGTRVYLYVYWHLQTIPDGVKPNYSFVAARGGKTVLHDSFSGTKPSYSVGKYWAVFPLKLRNTGTYVFKGRVAIGSVSRTGSTSVTVHK